MMRMADAFQCGFNAAPSQLHQAPSQFFGGLQRSASWVSSSNLPNTWICVAQRLGTLFLRGAVGGYLPDSGGGDPGVAGAAGAADGLGGLGGFGITGEGTLPGAAAEGKPPAAG